MDGGFGLLCLLSRCGKIDPSELPKKYLSSRFAMTPNVQQIIRGEVLQKMTWRFDGKLKEFGSIPCCSLVYSYYLTQSYDHSKPKANPDLIMQGVYIYIYS